MPGMPRGTAGGHTYLARVEWTGSTGVGYRAYPRAHTAWTPPATEGFDLSADPHFRGDGDLPNPEQLLVLAASSCQLLSFLAVAARAGLDVVGYEDDAVGGDAGRRDAAADHPDHAASRRDPRGHCGGGARGAVAARGARGVLRRQLAHDGGRTRAHDQGCCQSLGVASTG